MEELEQSNQVIEELKQIIEDNEEEILRLNNTIETLKERVNDQISYLDEFITELERIISRFKP